MLACMVKNNIITNVLEVTEGADLALLKLRLLPEGKWIGDTYHDETSPSDYQVVWDEMAAAYKEGVQEA